MQAGIECLRKQNKFLKRIVMKKNYLVVIFMFLFPVLTFAQEQYIIWSDDFDGTSPAWTFHSLDENPYTWSTSKNWVMNSSFTAMVDGELDVLAWRSYTQAGVYSNNPPTDDWTVSPMIDLTGASGSITLAINFQNDLIDQSQSLPVYISTTSDIQSIKNSTPFTTFNFSHPQFTVQFQELTADISSFAGQQIYLAFGKKKTSGDVTNSSEIDYVNIISDTPASTPVTGVSLNKPTLSLVAGTSETLTATVTPTDATNKEVTWSSSNEAVATVDAAGKVTAVAAGTAEITATTKDGGKTAKCTVTVTAAIDYSWLKAAAIAVEGNKAKVVGPDADKFTLFYIDNQPATLINGQADLTGKTGGLSLKATTADGSGVIKLKISK